MSAVMNLKVSEDVQRWMNEHASDPCYIVEINSSEKSMLWEKYKNYWVDNNGGYMITVGTFHGHPVCISLGTFLIHGQQVVTVDPTSMLVNHQMIDDWLSYHFPKLMPADGYQYRNHDSSNFHLVTHRAISLNEQQLQNA